MICSWVFFVVVFFPVHAFLFILSKGVSYNRSFHLLGVQFIKFTFIDRGVLLASRICLSLGLKIFSLLTPIKVL